MGDTRKCGNMSNIKNILHEPVTTNRKNNGQSDRSMSRNSNSSEEKDPKDLIQEMTNSVATDL